MVRLSPTVHGDGDKGFVAFFVNAARKKGASVYVKEGNQRWAAVHRLDAARLFRLALEKGRAGGIYHGVADEGVRFGDIAAAIGQGLGVPAVSKSAFGALRALGFFGFLAGLDGPASSRQTQQELGWSPTHPTLLEDLKSGIYFRG